MSNIFYKNITELPSEIQNNTSFTSYFESVDTINQGVDKLSIVKDSCLAQVNNNLAKQEDLKKSKKNNLSNLLLYENKLIDFKWEILLESCSTELTSINQIKILVKIKYLNSLLKEICEVNILLTEEEFIDFSDEINKLVKYF